MDLTVSIDRSKPLDISLYPVPYRGHWYFEESEIEIESESATATALSTIDLSQIIPYDGLGYVHRYGRRYERISPGGPCAVKERGITLDIRIERAKEDGVVLLDAALAFELLKAENRQKLEWLIEKLGDSVDLLQFPGTIIKDRTRGPRYALSVGWIRRSGEACLRCREEPGLRYSSLVHNGMHYQCDQRDPACGIRI